MSRYFRPACRQAGDRIWVIGDRMELKQKLIAFDAGE